MMSSASLEARVGIFVFAALVVLVGFVLALGDVSLTPRIALLADFGFAGGLQEGAPVKVSGIRVGRVQALSLLGPDTQPPSAASLPELGRSNPPLVRAVLGLEPDSRPLLTQGARLSVASTGLIGESYLELSPGPRGAPPLAEGAAIRGVDAPELHVMTLNLASLVSALGGLTAGPESEGAAAALGALLRTLNGVVGERRAELGKAIEDVAAAAGELRGLLAELHRAVRDDRLQRLLDDSGAAAAVLREDLPRVMDEAKRGLAGLSQLGEHANAVLTPETLAQVVAEVQRATHNLEAASADARRIVARIERGEGSVGGLVEDPQLYDDLKEMLRDLKRNPWKVFWRD